jgi:2-polyprenyl-3-methyl-5-hydroxy-6-metoxy-1,4-benzoquinol methylase/uncharacterized protein YbaR (Trm112 family)
MKNSVAGELICIRNGCGSNIEIECIRNSHDDCIEGFLHCKDCRALYPILDGVAIIVDDFASYASERPKILGKWLVESKSTAMKEFLKENASCIKATTENKYEEGGAWFLPYLAMHSARSKVDKHFAKMTKQDFRSFYRNVTELVAHRFTEGGLCLEVGCAVGTITNELAQKTDFVFGVDQSFSFIKEARKRSRVSNAEFLVANSLRLPFARSKFNLIVSLNMIDLVDPDKLIANINSLVAINGSVLLTDPYDFRDDRGNPRALYDGKSLRKLLRNTGFSVDTSTSHESFIPWILRINNRAYLVYFTDLIIAKKSR